MDDEDLKFNEAIRIEIASFFRELRDKYGYNKTLLVSKLQEKYDLKISPNLLGKIENNKSKLQLHQYLALATFFGLDNKEILGHKKETHDLSDEIITSLKINPDIHSIVKTLVDNSENKEFIKYIKSLTELSLDLQKTSEPKKSKRSILKAASPRKKQK